MKKPTVKLVGTDGNIFSIIGLCTKALKQAGQIEQAKEMTDKAFKAVGYHEAIAVCMEYVDAE